MELTLNIDESGRTAPPPSDLPIENPPLVLDYTTKTTDLIFDHSSNNNNASDIHNMLIQNCKETTGEDLPLTFWLAANDDPRCLLEQLAKDIFMYHVKSIKEIDPDTSGCEWWVQLRPSLNRNRINSDAKEAQRGIEFHWDKDETLRDATGVFVHPHLSTVTYLTSNGAPTMVFDDSTPDEELLNRGMSRAFVSWPLCGKHLSFDGRFLHGAPSDLSNDCDTSIRCTFLVNIWLHHKPLGVQPFPKAFLSKMTKIQTTPVVIPRSSACVTRKVIVENTLHRFTWKLGPVSIHATIPMKEIQEERQSKANSGNIEICWPVDNMVTVRVDDSC